MNKYSGSNFDDFLKEEGILEEVSGLARKQLEESDNTSGLINRFLQSVEFNNQFVLRAVGICVFVVIGGFYLGNHYLSQYLPGRSKETGTQFSELTSVSPPSVKPEFVRGRPTSVVESVRVSRFGFGAFPKIPTDFPSQNIWNVVEKQFVHDPEGAKNLELLARVRIKLWTQGKRTKGVIMDPSTGLVYADSDIEILFPTSPDLPKYDTYFDEDFVPSEGIVVEFLEGGIDPYKFLNLRR